MNTTILFDGNYLFYRALHAIKGFNNKKRFLDDDEEQAIFVRKVTTDFISIINKLKHVHKIVFVKDSKSWRASYYEDYKANRKDKEDDINWNNFYKCIDEFLEIIKNNKIIISNIDRAEGDDLIALWSNYLNSINENVIIISGDADLTQLVNYNKDTYTVVFNVKSSDRRIIAKLGLYELLLNNKDDDDISIFNSSKILKKQFGTDPKQFLLDLINSDIDYEEIDPNEIMLKKVLCGDDIDNIPSIYLWGELKANGKLSKRITNKDYVKVKDFLLKNENKISIKDLQNSFELQNKVRIILENSSKTKIDKNLFTNNLIRNIHLVILDKEYIPSDIQDTFNKELENINLVPIYNLDRITLLENTKFEKDMSLIKIVSV